MVWPNIIQNTVYNPHNDCSLLINKFIPVLGFWHNYKELCLIIWKKGLQSFFGPLFHSLWPESSILFKPKLGHIEIFFTYISLAYDDEFKYDIDTFIQASPEGSQSKRILSDIKFLLNAAIPFVILVSVTVCKSFCF